MNKHLTRKLALSTLIGIGVIQIATAADSPSRPTETNAVPVAIKIASSNAPAMTPQEREAQLKELREKRQSMSPEQRDEQLKVIKQRMETRITELKKKKDAGTITDPEKRQLESMESRLKRWDELYKKTATNSVAKPIEIKPADNKPTNK